MPYIQNKQHQRGQKPNLGTKRLLFVLIGFFSGTNIIAQDLIPFLDDTAYGYADRSGQIVIAANFDEAKMFRPEGIAPVRKGKYWSYVNQAGKLIAPFETDRKAELQNVFHEDSAYDWTNGHGADTIFELRILRYTPTSFRLLHISNGSVTPVYDFNNEKGYHREPPIAATYKHGMFVGRISDTTYHVLDRNLDHLLTTKGRPQVWSDSIVTIEEEKNIAVFNVLTKQKRSLAYSDLFSVIDGKYFIVTRWAPNPEAQPGQRRDKQVRALLNWRGDVVIDFVYDFMWSGSSGNPLVAGWRGKETLFIHKNGEPLDTNRYKSIYYLSDNYYRGQLQNGKWVFLEHSGLRAIPESFDTILAISNHSYNTQADGVCSLLDSILETKVSYPADRLQSTSAPGYFTIVKEKKYGLIDSTGRVIVPPSYDACWTHQQLGLIEIAQHQKKGFLRFDGTWLFKPVYENLGYRFEEGKGLFYARQGNTYTYYDEQGNMVRDSVMEGQLGLRSFYTDHQKGIYQVRNRWGNPIGPKGDRLSYRSIDTDSSERALLFQSDRIFVLHPDGTLITNDSIRLERNQDKFCTTCGRYAVTTGDRQGVLDHHGHWIISPSAQEIIGVTDHMLVIRREGLVHLYDIHGVEISKEPFSNIGFRSKQPYWAVERNERFGFIDSKTGEIQIGLIYSWAHADIGKYMAVRTSKENTKEKSILIDTLGNTLLETEFDSLEPILTDTSDRHFFIYQGNKKGVIHINGQIIVPPKYQDLSVFADTTFFISIQKDNSIQLINRNGKVFYALSVTPKAMRHILLGHRQYAILFDTHTILVDEFGTMLRTIEDTAIKVLRNDKGEVTFLEIKNGTRPYFIDANSLVVFKKG